MSYRIDKTTNELVIDGWEKGIAPSPYQGIGNIRNVNTSYYPGVAYVNYKRLPCTLNGGVMTNPVQKTVSPAGLIYILDDSGQVWKQSQVNSSTFNLLGNSGRTTNGSGGIAYWQNYLAVFGNGVIEFCGNGTGDSGVVSGNWNLNQTINISQQFTTNFAAHPNNLYSNGITYSQFSVGQPIVFSTTGTLPAPLVAGTTYYIKSVDGSGIYYTVSATYNGTVITLTSDGSGIQTANIPFNVSLPIGNVNNISMVFPQNSMTAQINSYTNPNGTVVANGFWQLSSGLYNVPDSNGFTIATNFVNGSNLVSMLSAMLFQSNASSVWLLNPSVQFYRPYVSKVDGSLYFCNGQFLGRIAISTNTNVNFNPSDPSSYSVSFGVASLPEQYTDTIVDMVDLKNQLVVAGQKDIYIWDYISAATSSPSPVGELISSITNLLNNIYILAGQKGNLYVSNGYNAQLLYKLPDYISGVIDPVIAWGGLMVHRSKLYFQALISSS